MIVSRSAVPRAAAGSRGARHGAPLPPATTSASVRRSSSSSSKGGARLSLRCAATVSDSNVPEGHKGLHSSLYGDGSTAAEDAHAAESAYAPVAGEDDGAALVPVDAYLAAREGRKPAGVFAVHDASRAPQYVGFSRNLVLSLRSLRARLGPSRVAFVRALVVTGQEMLTRAALARRAQEWIDAAPGGVPPGNGAEAELWGGGGGGGGAGSVEASVDTSAMSPAELAAHEERRLKLRRAMGEAAPLPAAQTDADADAEERRQRMIAAMEVSEGVCVGSWRAFAWVCFCAVLFHQPLLCNPSDQCYPSETKVPPLPPLCLAPPPPPPPRPLCVRSTAARRLERGGR